MILSFGWATPILKRLRPFRAYSICPTFHDLCNPFFNTFIYSYPQLFKIKFKTFTQLHFPFIALKGQDLLTQGVALC